jgi:hypothetical protein
MEKSPPLNGLGRELAGSGNVTPRGPKKIAGNPDQIKHLEFRARRQVNVGPVAVLARINDIGLALAFVPLLKESLI